MPKTRATSSLKHWAPLPPTPQIDAPIPSADLGVISREVNNVFAADDATHGPTLGCDCLQKAVFVENTEALAPKNRGVPGFVRATQRAPGDGRDVEVGEKKGVGCGSGPVVASPI